METQNFPFIVTTVAVSCLTNVLSCISHVALKICRDLFYGKTLAQVLATIQIFQSQNILNMCICLQKCRPPLLFVYSFYTAQQTELGLYLSSWGPGILLRPSAYLTDILKFASKSRPPHSVNHPQNDISEIKV